MGNRPDRRVDVAPPANPRIAVLMEPDPFNPENIQQQWRSRITGFEFVAADQLMGHPDNARIHPTRQQKSMRSVIGRVGLVGVVVVSQRTGRILDGHMRAQMAISENQSLPVVYVDITEDEETVVLATYNAVAGQAVIDTDMYDALIANIPEPDAALTALLDDTRKQWADKSASPGSDETDPADGNLDDFVYGMVGWSETKVSATADEIGSLTDVHVRYRAENGGNDQGFVAWLISHVEN